MAQKILAQTIYLRKWHDLNLFLEKLFVHIIHKLSISLVRVYTKFYIKKGSKYINNYK